jgi:hypothetical protein
MKIYSPSQQPFMISMKKERSIRHRRSTSLLANRHAGAEQIPVAPHVVDAFESRPMARHGLYCSEELPPFANGLRPSAFFVSSAFSFPSKRIDPAEHQCRRARMRDSSVRDFSWRH